MAPLRIHAVPFRPSRLSIPPSPFSPRPPLTPPTTPPPAFFASAAAQRLTVTRTPHSPPPQEPIPWIWRCHLCHEKYRLGVTRRCLNDGHVFCSGRTDDQRGGGSSRTNGKPRRARRHAACESEFDYYGWRDRGNWRRAARIHFDIAGALSPISEQSEPAKDARNCAENCDYPSECRWRMVQAAQRPCSAVSSPSPTAAAPEPTLPPTTFEHILEGIDGGSSQSSYADGPTSEPRQQQHQHSEPEPGKEGFWRHLMLSAMQRRASAAAKSAGPSRLTAVESSQAGGDACFIVGPSESEDEGYQEVPVKMLSPV